MFFIRENHPDIFIYSSMVKFSLNEFSTSSAMLLVTSFALYGGIAVRNKIKGKAYQKILRLLLFLLAIILLIQVSI